MDVRCPRCQSEYELDDGRVTDDGVTVKCSECQHVFRVKKKSLVMTLPVRDDQVPTAPLPPTAQAREWKVRQPNGNIYLCRELTTLQKWIIEGKVGRDDEISLTGETWKRLGNIPELASFFQVVEDAKKGRAYDAIRASQVDLPAVVPPPPPPPSIPPGGRITDTWKEPNFTLPPPAAPPPPPVPSAPVESLKETIKAPSFAAPPPESKKPAPRPAQAAAEIDERELERAVRGGGGMKWVALILGGLLVGGGAGYYFGFYEPEQQAKADAERLAAQRAADDARVKAEQEAARQKAEAEAEAQRRAAAEAVLDAGAPDAGLDAGSAIVDAGVVAVVVDAGVDKPADAGAKAPKGTGATEPVAAPGGRSYDFYMERGDALRDAEKPSAALSFYGKAADLKPDRVEPVVGRGFALFDMGQMLQAEASFEQALRINGRYGPAIMGMAEVQKAQGKKTKAIEFYQRYLDEHPSGSEANVAKNAIERLKE